jgi:hypothetical protein
MPLFLTLPERFSPEAHALFRAYQEVWNIKEPIMTRMGEPYWQLCRASIYSLLEAIIKIDNQTLNKNEHRTIHPTSSPT